MESVEVILAGYQRKGAVISPEEKKIIAYHEVGHALVAAKQKNSAPVQKITIIPRTSGALGYTLQVDEGEKSLMSKEELFNKIATFTGGRVAEELKFGSITTGASNDIEQATRLARGMITRYGMSEEFGMVALETINNQYLGGDTSLACSNETATKIDAAVVAVVKQAHEKAVGIIRENMNKLDEIAQFPPIQDLNSKLAICLGLNMIFNLIIQTDAQLTLKYGDAAKVIKGNCGNQVYLQTSEEETAKLYSSLLGSKTITNVNRVGTRFALNKSYTETQEERPLLNPRELMDLEEGENVILRTMYRRDLKGNPVKPHPIFNSRKEGRAFLYRYQYLQEYFPDADTVSEESLHLPTLKAVQEDELMYDYDISFEAADFQQIPKQLQEVKEELKRAQDATQAQALEEMKMQMEWRYQELAEKQIYQWDTRIKRPQEHEHTPTHERQFAALCRELAVYDSQLLELLLQGCAAGEVFVRVVQNPKIPLEKKGALLSQLKPRIGLV